jgi:hypothetical protein
MSTLKHYTIKSRSFVPRRGKCKGQRFSPVALNVAFNPAIGKWDEIRRIVAFCWSFVVEEAVRENGPNAPVWKSAHCTFSLELKHSYRWCGLAFPWRRRCFVKCANRSFNEPKHPLTWRYNKWKSRDGFPTYQTHTWHESLIAMVAHELWHLAGDLISDQIESEIRAELTTDAALTVWRKKTQ